MKLPAPNETLHLHFNCGCMVVFCPGVSKTLEATYRCADLLMCDLRRVHVVMDVPLAGIPSRVETGPVQFGDDWPGVFIRGDAAIYFGERLEGILGVFGMEMELVERDVLQNLAGHLLSCGRVVKG